MLYFMISDDEKSRFQNVQHTFIYIIAFALLFPIRLGKVYSVANIFIFLQFFNSLFRDHP